MLEILIPLPSGLSLQVRHHPQPGPAIIFLHSSGSNLLLWQRIILFFQPHYHLILVDLRGHGRSTRPGDGYHMDTMAADIHAAMQQLNIEKAHIVGSSLGAEVGLSLAANYSQQVLSLACDGAQASEYGPYGLWEGSEDEFQAHVNHRLETIHSTPEPIYPSLEALVAARRQVLEKYGWWNEYFEVMVRYGAEEVSPGQFSRVFNQQASFSYMSNYFYYRLEDYYPRVQCPLLLLTSGEFDSEREKSALYGLSRLAPRSQVAVLPGWQHPYGWLLDPEPVSNVLLDFLSKANSSQM